MDEDKFNTILANLEKQYNQSYEKLQQYLKMLVQEQADMKLLGRRPENVKQDINLYNKLMIRLNLFLEQSYKFHKECSDTQNQIEQLYLQNIKQFIVPDDLFNNKDNLRKIKSLLDNIMSDSTPEQLLKLI
ncbi:hypothetical protein pb186bvf_008102 [Paramecium bursaria]